MPEIRNKIAAEALRSINSNTFAGSYQNLGTALTQQSRLLKITNDTTVGVTISFDGGTTDHEYLPAGSFLLLDVCANHVWDAKFVWAIGTQVAVKGSAGTGLVYLSTYYAT